MKSNKLYANTVEITSHYLGPSADRFINRQIRNHLGKDPEDLVSEDLLQLIDWIRIAMVFLTDDDDIINEYLNSLQQLATKRWRKFGYGRNNK